MQYRILLSLLVALLIAPTIGRAAPLAERAGVTAFIDEMVRDHQFNRAELERLFATSEFRDSIIEAISRPAEAKPWHQYRPIFVTASRIGDGVNYCGEHRDLLLQVTERYGVPAEILCAIVGVETRYGRYQGSYPVVDALGTLAFGYPKRARFFRKQLVEYLLMAREEGFDPATRLGSYAGAMGQPQFIPSSFRAYAIDFDQSGQRDLWQSSADILGSVAHYLQRHRWQRGQPIAVPAKVSGSRWQALRDRGYQPSIRVAELADYGVTPLQPLARDAKVALLTLAGAQGEEAWLVLDNFYAITRYNHSPLYAMAVFQLAEGIAGRPVAE